MSTIKESTSPAIGVLCEHEIDFREYSYIYRYQEKNVASAASQEPGLDEHVVIKTLVIEDDRKQPFIALMQGDKQVSTKALARTLKVKSANPSGTPVCTKVCRPRSSSGAWISYSSLSTEGTHSVSRQDVSVI